MSMWDNENQKDGQQNSYEETTTYTTPEGGSGMRYEPYHRTEQPWQADAKHGTRVLAISVSLLLCLCLCFGAGAVGGWMMRQWTLDASSGGNNGNGGNGETVGTPTGDTTPDNNGSMLSNGGSTGLLDDSNRNPLPDMDKSEPLSKLTYSGSAGENAYGSLTEAIGAVAASVVEISTETTVNGGWLGNYVSSGAGSGVIISEDGYIVTNNHVIADADVITVRLTNGNTYTALPVGADAASDIAVLWIDTEEQLLAAQLGCSRDLIVGETVFAIGNPLGSLGGTVTNGIISATARDIIINNSSMTLLQTNAAVNPGNSGGGLFNMAGQLIGVVNAKCSEDDVEGLGFAIPIDTAYSVICELIEYGYVRGVVDHGLDLYDVSLSNLLVARRYFNCSYTGVYIWNSAYSKELKYGDLIISVNGESVSTSDEVEMILSGCAVGDEVSITVWRNDKELTYTLVLREYVPASISNRATAP